MDAIIATSEVELPEVVVEKQLDDVMQDLNYRLSYQGLSLQDYAKYQGLTLDQLRAEHKKDAERIAKMRQVLEAIVRAEKFVVDDNEIDKKLAEFAKMANKSLEDYKKSVDSRRIDYIYSDILMSKVMNLLTSKNTIVNKCGCDCGCEHDHEEHECTCGDDCEHHEKKPAKKTANKKASTKTTETKEKTTKLKTATKKTTKNN